MSYSFGSIAEVGNVLYRAFSAWRETEGALEFLHSARDIAKKDCADEAFEHSYGPDRTVEGVLRDVSLNRVWQYFNWAVEEYAALPLWEKSEHFEKESYEAWS